VTRALSLETPTHGRVLVEDAAGSPSGVLVGFHGYGANAEVMLRELTSIPGLDGWQLIAVQALHRFYTRDHRTVVASWMTSQDRDEAIADNVAYVDRVVAGAAGPMTRGAAGLEPGRLVFLGFSQGASMAYRAALLGRYPAAGVVAIGGDIPPELKHEAAEHRWPPVLIAAGVRDEWFTGDKLEGDVAFLKEQRITHEVVRYDGAHEWTDELRASIGHWISSLFR
jgi:predicted esterase